MKNGVSFLYGHNRGHNYMNCMSKNDGSLVIQGATFESFKDCKKDIEVWVNKIKSLGYQRIILMGHSLGCNKALHYMVNTDSVFTGLILASPADMVGLTKEDKNYAKMLEEAKYYLSQNEPQKILTLKIDGTEYVSAANFMENYVEECPADNFPIIRNPQNFFELAKVNVPILAIAGSLEHKAFKEICRLDEKARNCPNYTYKIIENANHFYFGKETEIGNLLIEWIYNKLK